MSSNELLDKAVESAFEVQLVSFEGMFSACARFLTDTKSQLEVCIDIWS